MIKIYIRTTSERKLDESISRELGSDYELLIDYEHKPTKAFIDSLKKVKGEDVIFLEDDVILCRNFKERILDVISHNQSKLINFFTFPTLYKFKIATPNQFCYNQCTYYPKGIINLMLEYVNNYNDIYEETSPEKVCKRIFTELNILSITYRPCLVQHLDNGSLMSHNRSFSRRTPYFVDYLDELGITYEEANTHKEELINLMKEKFKDIDKN